MRDEIFAYEFALEAAWAQHLARCGLSVNIDFADTKKKTPFVDEITYAAEPTGTIIKGPDGKDYYWVFRGPLSTRFVVARGPKSAEELKGMVGRTRIESQRYHEVLNEGPFLPDHWINEMVETPSARGHAGDEKHDWFELRWTVTLNIRPAAFTS